jgi:hypothetical protein
MCNKIKRLQAIQEKTSLQEELASSRGHVSALSAQLEGGKVGMTDMER